MSTTQEITALLAATGLPTTSPVERLAGLPPATRVLHRRLLEEFAATGRAPDLAAVAGRTGPRGEAAWLAVDVLAEADLLALDDAGNLAGVFPFSAVPTRHEVRVGGDPSVFAMCAIDALGIPAMLGRPGLVSSRDPITGTTVTVEIRGGDLRWDPPGAVVLVGRAGDGPVATSCCRIIDFYVGRAVAEQALAGPGLRGVVVNVPEAHALGVALFGDQLAVAAPEQSTG